MKKKTEWTSKLIRDLDFYWNRMTLTAEKIAEKMALPSKNAVIGKARKLGWSPRPPFPERELLEEEYMLEQLKKEEAAPAPPAPASLPEPVLEPKPSLPKRTQKPLQHRHRPVLPPAIPQPAPKLAPPKPIATEPDRFTVSVWSDRGRYELKSVTLEEYRRLWDEGRLQFQREGVPKPPHLPDR